MLLRSVRKSRVPPSLERPASVQACLASPIPPSAGVPAISVERCSHVVTSTTIHLAILPGPQLVRVGADVVLAMMLPASKSPETDFIRFHQISKRATVAPKPPEAPKPPVRVLLRSLGSHCLHRAKSQAASDLAWLPILTARGTNTSPRSPRAGPESLLEEKPLLKNTDEKRKKR